MDINQIQEIVPIIKARANVYTDKKLAAKEVKNTQLSPSILPFYDLVRKVRESSRNKQHDIKVSQDAILNTLRTKQRAPINVEVYWRNKTNYTDKIENYFNADRNGGCFSSKGEEPGVRMTTYTINKVVGVMSNKIKIGDCWDDTGLIGKEELQSRLNAELDELMLDGTEAFLRAAQDELFAKANGSFVHFGNLPATVKYPVRPSGTILPIYVDGQYGKQFNPRAISRIRKDVDALGITNPLYVGSDAFDSYIHAINTNGIAVNGYDMSKDKIFTASNYAVINSFIDGNFKDDYLAVLNLDNIAIESFAPLTAALQKSYAGKVTRGTVKSPFLGLDWYVTIVFDDECNDAFQIQLETVLAVLVTKRCKDDSLEPYMQGTGGAGFIYTLACGDVDICVNDPILRKTFARTALLQPCDLSYEQCVTKCYMTLNNRVYTEGGVEYIEFVADFRPTDGQTFNANAFEWTINGSPQSETSNVFRYPTQMLANQIVRVTMSDTKGCSSTVSYPDVSGCSTTEGWTIGGVSFNSAELENGFYNINLGEIGNDREVAINFMANGADVTINSVENIVNAPLTSGLFPSVIPDGDSYEAFITVTAGSTTAVFTIESQGMCSLPETINVRLNYTIATT
jgi:hypothetical protein